MNPWILHELTVELAPISLSTHTNPHLPPLEKKVTQLSLSQSFFNAVSFLLVIVKLLVILSSLIDVSVHQERF